MTASPTVTVLSGDCLDILPTLPDASVDAIVTDPPAGIAFMGKGWDTDKGGRRQWIAWLTAVMVEAHRVLKPGGHALVWALPRTSHWTATALEDAGFEIRDCVVHLFGSGFPKSLDVSKAIDKARVEDREPVRVVCRAIRAAMDAAGVRSRDITRHFGDCHPRLIDHWAARDTDSQPALPKWDQWLTLKAVLPTLGDALDAEVWRLNGRKGTPGETWDQREVTGTVAEWANRTNYAITSRDGLRRDVPATDDAKRWDGWGTALKPGQEHWWLVRKPLEGTVAANVLAHGVGGINVDGCRVDGPPPPVVPQPAFNSPTGQIYGMKTGEGRNGTMSQGTAGRWPTNSVLTHSQSCPEDGPCAGDCPVGELDRQSGNRPGFSSQTDKSTYKDRNAVYGRGVGNVTPGLREGFNDSGGASRFYPTFRYQAKAPSKERPKVNGVSHPTAKSLGLMRWLVRLITPPGGVVLDPFAGSGATLEAAALEGFSAIGIEAEADYLPLIQARIDRVSGQLVLA